MDRSEFDQIARLLGGAASRRAGLKAAFAALVGGAGGLAAGAQAEAKPRSRGEREEERSEADAEKRPCGPKPKDNRCRKDRDCCTNYCVRKKKKQGKGKRSIGRCRCVKVGRKCKSGQKCCGGTVCQTGICTPRQPGCKADGAACSANAECCANSYCDGAACAPKTVCTVCPTCAYTTVQAAIDALQTSASMSTVRIAGGEYVEDLTVTGKIELANCNGEAVTLRNATADATRYQTIVMPDPGAGTAAELVLTSVTVSGKTPFSATFGGGGLTVYGSVTMNGTASVSGCSNGDGSNDSYAAFHLWDNASLIMNDKASISGNLGNYYGGGLYIEPGASLTMNGSSSISGNTSGSYGGAVSTLDGATVTMNDDSVMSGNIASSEGGAVHLYSTGSALVMNGRAAITGNTSGSSGYGGGVVVYEDSVLTMNDDSAISENTADRGGGVWAENYADEVNVVMHENSRISSNDASLGAGVYLNQAAQLTMDGSSAISGNTATGDGGGVYMLCITHTQPPVKTEFTSVTLSGSAAITGNSAVQGGGVFGALEFTVTGTPGKVIGGAGITGNTPPTEQCKGTDKPTCV
ncbi:MAG: hypothetical protein ACKOWF_01820 [Chloroflexota bacterium]